MKNCLLLLATVLLLLSFAEAQTAGIPFKIGATLPLTGDYAFIGKALHQGLAIGVEEVNAAGGINGRPLELITEDNGGDAKSAVSGSMKLLDIDRVDYLISTFTHITQAVKGLAAKKRKLLFYISTVKTIAEENSLFFRDYFDVTESGALAARYINSAGYKRASFILEESDVCETFESGFNSQQGPKTLQITSRESYHGNNPDFKSILLRIKTKNPDVLVLCTWKHTHLLMTQLKQLGIIWLPTVQVVGPYMPVSDSKQMRSLYEENKAVTTWYGFSEAPGNEISKAFAQKHQKRFSEPPRSDAAYAYDDIKAIAKALSDCEKRSRRVDPSCVAEGLLYVDREGAGGRLKFDKNGISSREVFLMNVLEGKWRELDPPS